VLGAIGSLATLPLIPDEAPDAIVPISIAIAVVSLLGALYLWQGRRWAAILLFVVTAFNGLSSAPGVFEADEAYNKVLAAIGVVLTIVVCALILQRSTRAALR
jgi:hypothetical protein